MKIQRPPERMLFGQFLLEQRYLTGNELALALFKQSKERIHHHNTRRLGEILFRDYRVFKTEADLEKALEAFREYREAMSDIYNDAREIVRAEEPIITGCIDTTDAKALQDEVGIDLGGVEIEELQSYVSAIDSFLDAADEIAHRIRLRQCDKEGMIEVVRKMADIRQALLSIASKG